MTRAHVNAKGQILIPVAVRQKLGITKGTPVRIEVDEEHHMIILTPITRAYIDSFRGRHKGKHLLEALAEEKALE